MLLYILSDIFMEIKGKYAHNLTTCIYKADTLSRSLCFQISIVVRLLKMLLKTKVANWDYTSKERLHTHTHKRTSKNCENGIKKYNVM